MWGTLRPPQARWVWPRCIIAAQHGAVPASLHLDAASRDIDWESQGLRLATELTEWPAVDGQRIAAVSAFGMSGTNAHAVVSIPEDPEIGRNTVVAA